MTSAPLMTPEGCGKLFKQGKKIVPLLARPLDAQATWCTTSCQIMKASI